MRIVRGAVHLVVLVALVAAVAGCAAGDTLSDPVGSVTPPDVDASPTIELTGGQECSNSAAGYTVRYPDAWYVNDGDVAAPCTLFDKEPVAVEPGTDPALELGVVLGTAAVGITTLADSGGINVEEQTRTTLAGRTAVVQRGRGSGDALIPNDTRVYRYLVDLGDGSTLIASTYDTGDLPFARKAAVLDAMMGTLTVD